MLYRICSLFVAVLPSVAPVNSSPGNPTVASSPLHRNRQPPHNGNRLAVCGFYSSWAKQYRLNLACSSNGGLSNWSRGDHAYGAWTWRTDSYISCSAPWRRTAWLQQPTNCKVTALSIGIWRQGVSWDLLPVSWTQELPISGPWCRNTCGNSISVTCKSNVDMRHWNKCLNRKLINNFTILYQLQAYLT